MSRSQVWPHYRCFIFMLKRLAPFHQRKSGHGLLSAQRVDRFAEGYDVFELMSR